MNPKQLLITMLLLLTLAISAQVPQMINYQAQLLDPTTDQPIADDTYQITFKIYDTEAATTAIWTEMHSVETQTGMYNVLLGSQYPVTNEILTGAEKWLGVKVGADNEMTPRKRFTSVAYAVKSETDDDWVKDGDDVYIETGNVGIGETNPTEKLEVNGTAKATEFTGFGIMPIGSITGWHKNAVKPMLALPDGWAECDGSAVDVEQYGILDPDGDGYYILPDLNGESRFFRGGNTSGIMQDATEINRRVSRDDNRPLLQMNNEDGSNSTATNTETISGTTATFGGSLFYKTRPINMSVVWIMRIK